MTVFKQMMGVGSVIESLRSLDKTETCFKVVGFFSFNYVFNFNALKVCSNNNNVF